MAHSFNVRFMRTERAVNQKRSKGRRISIILGFLGVLSLVLWLLLPKITETIAIRYAKQLGLGDLHLRVTKLGLTKTVAEDVSWHDGAWHANAERVILHSGILNLFAGQIGELKLEGLEVIVDIEQLEPSADQEAGSDLPSKANVALQALDGLLNIEAKAATIRVMRSGNELLPDTTFDLSLKAPEHAVVIRTSAGTVSAWVSSIEPHKHRRKVHLAASFSPSRTEAAYRSITGSEYEFIPSGLRAGVIEIGGDAILENGIISQAEMTCVIRDAIYQVGDTAWGLAIDSTEVKAVSQELGKQESSFQVALKGVSMSQKNGMSIQLKHREALSSDISGIINWSGDQILAKGQFNPFDLMATQKEVSIDLLDTSMEFELDGETLNASGSTVLDGNRMPFRYSHQYQSNEQKWSLVGKVDLQEVAIEKPMAQTIAFFGGMKGLDCTGKISAGLSFDVGSNQEFDGELRAGIQKGKLTFPEEGPVIDGLETELHISSLKQMKSTQFHPLNVGRIEAFGVTITNLSSEFQLQDADQLLIKRTEMSAFDGSLWVEPFTLPLTDEDFTFKLHANRLNLSQLVSLFPDFGGDVTGQLNGIIPISRVDGIMRLKQGQLALTPKTSARLLYDAEGKFTQGMTPKDKAYKNMKMVEDSLGNLDLQVLKIRIMDSEADERAIHIEIKGQALESKGSPPIHLNINAFKPNEDATEFFDLLLRHRDQLNFGL